MKYLIAGLGNIGEEYINTRHNIGFKVVEHIATDNGIQFADKRYAYVAQYKFKGRIYVLIKPTTYMNLSGKAVNYWMQKENINPANMLIIVDDIALPFGTIRMRAKGSDAGHNGLININTVLGHNNYPRLRFGIGSNFGKGQQVQYVLSEWTDEEKKALPEKIKTMAEAAISFGVIGLERTMNFYNGK